MSYGACGPPGPSYGLPANATLVTTETWQAGYTPCLPQYYPADSGSGETQVWFVPAVFSELPGPGQGGTTQSNTIYNAAPSTTESQQKANALAMLQNPQDDLFTQALCQGQGSPCASVPPPYTATIPTPSAGETWSQYQTDLADAGIKKIQRVVLSGSQVDPTKPAGAVTGVSPTAGAQIYPVTQTVTVTTNPDNLVQVPTCAGDASYGDCAGRLDSAGLTTHDQIVVTPAGADESKAAGAVLSVNHGADYVDPSTDIKVATDPSPLPSPQPAADNTDNDDNNPCDLTGGQQADPATQGQTEFQPYIGNPDDSNDPTNFQVTGGSPTFLLWGTTSADSDWGGWGFRHIYAKHGFGPADVTATRQALLAPVSVVDSTAPGAVDRHVYSGLIYWQGARKTIPCRRVVVVERGRIDPVNQPSDQDQTGIWTSYGEDLRSSS